LFAGARHTSARSTGTAPSNGAPTCAPLARSVAAIAVGAVVALLAPSAALLGCQSLETSTTTAAVEMTVGAAATPTTFQAPTTGQPPTTVASPTTTTGAPTSTTASEIIPGVPSAYYEDGVVSLTRPANSTITNAGFDQYLPLTESPQVAVVLPDDLFEGTNLLEAGVYIGMKAVAELSDPWDDPLPGEEAAGTERRAVQLVHVVADAPWHPLGHQAHRVLERQGEMAAESVRLQAACLDDHVGFQHYLR
jgi:hypothetical protein